MSNQSILDVLLCNDLFSLQPQELECERLTNLQFIRIMPFHTWERQHLFGISTNTSSNIEIGTYLSTQLTNRPSTLDALLFVEVTSKGIVYRHNLTYMTIG